MDVPIRPRALLDRKGPRLRSALLTVVAVVMALATSVPAGATANERVSVALATRVGSTSFQADAAHDGALSVAGLNPPLRRRWSANLGGQVSYPLVAGEAVFAAAKQDA